jgi:hypothetical protein
MTIRNDLDYISMVDRWVLMTHILEIMRTKAGCTPTAAQKNQIEKMQRFIEHLEDAIAAYRKERGRAPS